MGGARRRCSRYPGYIFSLPYWARSSLSNSGWTEPDEARPSTSPTTASTPTSSCPCAPAASIGRPVFPASDFAEPGRTRAGSPSARARSEFISNAHLVGHHAAHDLVGTDRRQAGDARRICPDPDYAVREIRLRPGRVSPLMGRDPRRFCARFQGKPQRIDHPGYGCCDAFFRAGGRQTRSAPATPGPRIGCGSPASRPASGLRSSRGWSGVTAGLSAKDYLFFGFAFDAAAEAAASNSALLMPSTRPLSPLPKLDSRIAGANVAGR